MEGVSKGLTEEKALKATLVQEPGKKHTNQYCLIKTKKHMEGSTAAASKQRKPWKAMRSKSNP